MGYRVWEKPQLFAKLSILCWIIPYPIPHTPYPQFYYINFVRTKKQEKKKPDIPLNTVELLRRVDFFSNLDGAALSRFERIATVQSFQNEETIMLAGDARKAIFFITRGQAKVFYDSQYSRSSILSLLGIGDFFGEIQLLNESSKSHISVIAEGECTVIIFPGRNFINEIINITELSYFFLKETALKLNRAYMQIASISMNTIRGRIKACIMQFVDERGVRIQYKNTSAIRLKNRPTQQQIAEMSGTSRETVNRELAVLIKNGYMELGNNDLILLKELPK
jgi:CRP-like cAMP-binding protein